MQWLLQHSDSVQLTHFIQTSYISALKFHVEPSDVVVPEGNSVLLPCEGGIKESKQNKEEQSNNFKVAPNIRWRGPDGQDIGIVGDTFR